MYPPAKAQSVFTTQNTATISFSRVLENDGSLTSVGRTIACLATSGVVATFATKCRLTPLTVLAYSVASFCKEIMVFV